MDRLALTPASVVAAAAGVADESGFAAVTLSEVARRLGVKTPSLYSHVRDLAALQDGVTALALAELTERVSAAIAGRSGADALGAYADALRAFARECPGRWDALQRRAGMGAVDSRAAREFVARTDAVLRGYSLTPGDRVHATRLIGATINGFIALERIGSFDHREPAPDASWLMAIGSLHAALLTWPPALAPTDREDLS